MSGLQNIFQKIAFGDERTDVESKEKDTHLEKAVADSIINWIEFKEQPKPQYIDIIAKLIKSNLYNDVLIPFKGTVYRGESLSKESFFQKFGGLPNVREGRLEVSATLSNLKGNSVSSWSDDYDVAWDFGGYGIGKKDHNGKIKFIRVVYELDASNYVNIDINKLNFDTSFKSESEILLLSKQFQIKALNWEISEVNFEKLSA